MQQGSLIRSPRKRGPAVWQFRWADRGLRGKRIFRKRVIGTVCQYPDVDFARKAVTGLLREINANPLQRGSLPMTIGESCDHFIQRELTKDNTWRSYSTKKAQSLVEEMDHPTLGDRTSLRSKNYGSRVMASAATACKEQLCQNQRRSGETANRLKWIMPSRTAISTGRLSLFILPNNIPP